MSAEKWNKRSPIEKGLIVGGTLVGTFILFRIGKKIYKNIADRKIISDYQNSLDQYNDMINTLPSGSIPPAPPTPPVFTSQKIKDFTDLLANKTIGWNFIYYPEIINKIVDLSSSEIQQLNDYWDRKYSVMSGGSLKWTLEDEDYYSVIPPFNHLYSPAINFLTNLGY